MSEPIFRDKGIKLEKRQETAKMTEQNWARFKDVEEVEEEEDLEEEEDIEEEEEGGNGGIKADGETWRENKCKCAGVGMKSGRW